jgi:uncharacterized protein (DUF433 family)
MSTALTYRFLEPRADSAYRQLFIKGTRIRAELVYAAHINADEPLTPQEVATDFGLPLDAVLESIAYCQSDPPEIAADHAEEESLMSARGQLDPNYRYDPRPKVLDPAETARAAGR